LSFSGWEKRGSVHHTPRPDMLRRPIGPTVRNVMPSSERDLTGASR
jgi:hypothetical protein